MKVPFISREQMIKVDKMMIDNYSINLFQMMENAGRNLAVLTRKTLKDVYNKKILVLVGSGGNGGGGLVAARRLDIWGANVTVLLAKPVDNFKGVPKHQLGIIERIGIKIIHRIPLKEIYEVYIDALVGYNLKNSLTGNGKEIIEWANNQNGVKISLDIPSGLDANSGMTETVFKADRTLTLALPKIGFLSNEAESFIGILYLGDISVPMQIYNELGIKFTDNLFSKNEIIKINLESN